MKLRVFLFTLTIVLVVLAIHNYIKKRRTSSADDVVMGVEGGHATLEIIDIDFMLDFAVL